MPEGPVDNDLVLMLLEDVVKADPGKQAAIPWQLVLPFLLDILQQWLRSR